MIDEPSHPRSLRSATAVAARRELLDQPHVAPLATFAADLREEGRGNVPDFDPLDGGVEACILFLLEKPGPMTDSLGEGRRIGSGFISRDNDDPTAEATFHFMKMAGIDRRLSVIWNAVPWWNGKRRVTPNELQAGGVALKRLLTILTGPKAVVLVGRNARRAKSSLTATSLKIIESAHPSPIVRATRPDAWKAIPLDWSAAIDA